MTALGRNRRTSGTIRWQSRAQIPGSVDREGGGSKSPTLLLGGGRSLGMFGMGVCG